MSWVEKYKPVRTATLAWVCWMITEIVFAVKQPEVLLKITSSGATVVLGIIGLFTAVIAFFDRKDPTNDLSQGTAIRSVGSLAARTADVVARQRADTGRADHRSKPTDSGL